MRASKTRSSVSGHWKMTTTNWENHWSWASYTYIKSCPRTQHWPFYSHSVFEANWKGKKLNKWNASCADQKKKKKKIVEVLSSLNLCNSNEHFLIRLWCATKSGLCKTVSDDQLRDWTKKKLQSFFPKKICTKKRSCSLFGGLLPIWSTTAFWILMKPLHLRSILSKLMWCTETAMPTTGIGQQKGS